MALKLRVCDHGNLGTQPIAKLLENILCNMLLVFACLLLLASSVVFALGKNPKDVNFSQQFTSVPSQSMVPLAEGPRKT
jgi:hypothetical protein